MYSITNYTKNQARKLNVIVKPSTRKNKKIDVFKYVINKDKKKELKKIASIGAIGYMDYPTYVKSKGLEYAVKRRILYRKRHAGEQKIIGSPGYYAWYLLW
ncbi:MAG: hypothetical protein ACW98D_16940 [Promethearchaeota archaeon]|jgi:hypothetical protein